ncbi:hypothetical protein F4818DRAFT_456322 [Hypoxylon cercidicola]|nr:hypothetical protein F4818DRAFT_456322 [Hypoxylon cercidicola]
METRKEKSSNDLSQETLPGALGDSGSNRAPLKRLSGRPSEVQINILETTVSEDCEPIPRKNSIRQSFGLTACVTLIGGTVVTLTVLGFLIFLWFGEGSTTGGEHASHVWRKIMLRGWLPQLTTLSSLVMRLTIGAQASLCTSLCAALVLERRKILKSQAAEYSVIRALNDGPFNLIKLALRQIPDNFPLHPEFLLLVCLFLAALGTQFASTILLSDLGPASVVQSPSTMPLNLYAGPSIDIDTSATDYWSEHPLSFPSFGETPPGYFAQPNERGLSDTGVKRRALLPFYQADDRTALRSCEGNAVVLSSRLGCMPPTITGQIAAADYSEVYYGTVAGRISYEDTFAKAGVPSARLCNSERCLSSYFNCTVMSISAKPAHVSTSSSFCFPQVIPEEQYDPSPWKLDDDPWGPESSPILVMSSELHPTDWKEASGEPIALPNSTVEAEWSMFELRPGKFMKISLCFMGLNVMFSNVHLQSAEKRSIISPEETVNKSAQAINTKDIQVLLGAEPATQDFSERGVFNIEKIVDDPDHVFFSDKNRSLSLAQNTTSVLEGYLLYTAQSMQGNTSASVCIRCSGYTTQATNPLYANLFSFILQGSNRAAVALQSIYTILGQVVYYDMLEVFDDPKKQSVWAIIGLFWKHSRHTLLGETWHTVSQLVSHETEDIMNGSGTIRDKDVKLFLKDDDPHVRLEQSSGTGRVEIVRCDRPVMTPVNDKTTR